MIKNNLIKQKNFSYKGWWGILLVGVILSLNSLSVVSSLEFDNIVNTQKITKDTSYVVGTETIDYNPIWEKYSPIEIKNWFNLGETLLEGALVQHTEFCGEDCSSTIEIYLENYGSLIEDVKFYTIENKQRFEQNIRDYQFYIKISEEEYSVDDFEKQCSEKEVYDAINETTYIKRYNCANVKVGSHIEKRNIWEEYSLGEEVAAGNYLIKLVGEKKPSRKVDWVIKTQGKWIEEWAVWGDAIMNTTGLINYYPFNEGSGKRLNDLVSGNTLSISNESNWNTGGISSDGFAFKPSSDENTDTNISTKDINQTGTITINLWLNRTGDVGNGNSIISNREGAGTNGRIALWGGTSSNLFQLITDDDSGSTQTDTGSIGVGEWVMATLRYNSSDAYLFLNGTEEIHHSLSSFYLERVQDFHLFSNDLNAIANVNYDDISFWNRGLNDSEINQLYNDGEGFFYPFANAKATPELPEDNYVTNENTISFVCSAVVGGAEITNISLWTNQSGNFQQENVTAGLSGALNSTGWNQTFIEDGKYLWGCQGCDTDGDCGFSANRTLTIDSVTPTLVINSGNGTLNYGILSNNHTVNYTITDISLDSCWLDYNGINTTIDCENGIQNTTNFALSYGINSAILWANDSVGNIGEENFNWTYRVLENERNYSKYSTITTLEEFKLNITEDGTQIPIIYLNYNGTQSLTSFSGGYYRTNITINNVGNIPFFWNITYGTNQFNTYTSNQTVSDLTAMSVTSGSCGTGLTKVLNFTFFDETNLTSLSNVNVKYNFKYGITNTTGATTFGNINVTELAVCLNTTASPVYNIGYGEVEYTDSTHSSRRYYMFEGTRLSNVTTYIPLYSLLNSESTSFLIEIRKPTLTPYAEKYTTLLRWYPELNEYKIVEMGQTDDKGQTVKKVKVEDADYRVGVYEKDGTLIYLANPIRMVCLASPCSYTLTVRESDTYTFDDIYEIQSSINYASETGIFTLTYNDPSQNSDLIEFEVYKVGGTASDILVCSSNSTSFTGILTCDASGESGLFKAIAFRTASPTQPFISYFYDTSSTVFQSKFGLFIQFIIAVVLIFAGIISPVVAIILGLVSLGIGVFLFKTMTYPIFIGVAILGGLVIHFMKESSR